VNIFLRELRANLKSLLIWTGIVVVFNLVGFLKFSAYYNNPEMLAILDSLPPAMLSAFSMSAFNLTTVTGFFGIMVTYFGLILAIAATMWGSGVISKEERDRTVEFSLTLPITRARLITAKTAAMVVDCIILLLITWGITLVSSQQYHPDSEFYRYVAIGMLSFLFLQMIFLALGIFLGCVLKKHKQSGSLAVWLLLGTYFLSILVGLNKDLDFLKYLTPFKYFDPAQLLHESRLEFPFVLLSAAIITALLAGAYASYNKRDLYI
jgi:ABC-2 type transport system permease protein